MSGWFHNLTLILCTIYFITFGISTLSTYHLFLAEFPMFHPGIERICSSARPLSSSKPTVSTRQFLFPSIVSWQSPSLQLTGAILFCVCIQCFLLQKILLIQKYAGSYFSNQHHQFWLLLRLLLRYVLY